MRALALGLMISTGCVPRLYSAPDTDTDTDAAWACEGAESAWPAATPPEGLVGEGFGLGEVIPDAARSDQNGDALCVWQFYGKPLVVDVSTMWCAPCQALARETQHTVEDYAEHDLVYLTMLAEDLDRKPASLDKLNEWANNFGIVDAPIIGDDASQTYARQVVSGDAFPALLVVGTDLRVVADLSSTPSDADLRAALDAYFE